VLPNGGVTARRLPRRLRTSRSCAPAAYAIKNRGLRSHRLSGSDQVRPVDEATRSVQMTLSWPPVSRERVTSQFPSPSAMEFA